MIRIAILFLALTGAAQAFAADCIVFQGESSCFLTVEAFNTKRALEVQTGSGQSVIYNGLAVEISGFQIREQAQGNLSSGYIVASGFGSFEQAVQAMNSISRGKCLKTQGDRCYRMIEGSTSNVAETVDLGNGLSQVNPAKFTTYSRFQVIELAADRSHRSSTLATGLLNFDQALQTLKALPQ